MLGTVALWGVVVPTAVAAVLMLVFLRPWSGKPPRVPERSPWAAAVALSVAYVIGHVGLPGAPALGSADIGRIIPLFALLGAVAGMVMAVVRPTPMVAWTIRIGLAATYGWLLVGPRLSSGLGLPAALLFVVGMVVACGLSWWSVARSAVSEPGPALTLALLLWGTVGSATLVMSGTALTGQLSGILLAALGGVFVIVWRWPAAGRLQSAAGVLSLTLVGQWAYALLYASMRWYVFAALVMAAPLLLIGRLPQLRDRTPAVRLVVRTTVLLLVLCIPAALAARVYFGAPGSGTGYIGGEEDSAAGRGGAKAAEDEDDDYGY